MKTKKVFLMLLVVGIVACGVVTQRVLATGTATTVTATAAANGVNCGAISKFSGTDTGAMTVREVKVNGETHAFTVTVGTDGSTRPRITFNPALNAGDKVVVTLSTIHEGEFKVNLVLSRKKGDC